MNEQQMQILQFATALGITTQLYSTRMSQLLSKHDLTIAQFNLLNHLLRSAPQKHTISDLTSALEINQPGVTKIIKKMDQLGIVSVETSGSDSRKKYVSITQKGAETVQTVMMTMGPDIAAWLADWDSAEIVALTASLRKLGSWLDENRLDRYKV